MDSAESDIDATARCITGSIRRFLVAWNSVPGPTLRSVVGDGAVVEGQIASGVNRAPEGITSWSVKDESWSVDEGGDVPGEGALVEVQGAGVVDAAAVAAAVAVAVGRVVVDGGVGDGQRARVVDTAAAAETPGVVAVGRVVVDGGVGDRQRATVVDAAAIGVLVVAVGAVGRVVVDGRVGDRQRAR